VSLTIANSNAHDNVLIIGGGIAGNALALFLHKAHIPCTVYEAYASSEHVGAGLGLAPNGMNVLAALGLADAIITRSDVVPEHRFTNARGQVLAQYTNGDVQRDGQPAVSVRRSVIYAVLHEAVVNNGIPVHYGKRLTGVQQYADSVTALFADGTGATGTLLVGADGVRSSTRAAILPDAPAPEFVGIVGIGGITPVSAVACLDKRSLERFNFVYGQRGFFGYAGVGNDEVQWWANLPSERELTRAEITATSVEGVRREMLAIYGDYGAPVPALIQNLQEAVKHNIYDIQSLPSWHHGRAILIGDAAHAVSPNSGQGASLALEDAMLLAKLLRDESSYASAFSRFEAARKPRVEKIVAEGRRRGNDKQIVGPVQQTFREWMVRIFVNLFGTSGQKALYGYRVAWD
jgi:2-polyprenyl-6-methoxyphenol hydroxylase-like FAD-dependent oxidoreductase